MTLEVSVNYNDGARSYDVSVREPGAIWWKVIATVGHAFLTPAALQERVDAAVVRYQEVVR